MHLMLSTHPLPPPREQTDAGENITFPQLAGGNNVRCRFRDSMQISRDENRLEQTDFAFSGGGIVTDLSYYYSW